MTYHDISFLACVGSMGVLLYCALLGYFTRREDL